MTCVGASCPEAGLAWRPTSVVACDPEPALRWGMVSRICFLMFLCAFALQAHADAVAGPSGHAKVQILVLDLRADGVGPEVTRALGDAVASELAHRPGVEVMTMADVRGAIDLTASTTAAGCDDPAHCEAAIEFAGAHGASVVVSGSVGLVDGAALLTLTALDARTSRMLGRTTTTASQVKGLLPKVPGVIDDMLGSAVPLHLAQVRAI